MRRVRLAWLAAFALVLRAVAPLGMPATAAVASNPPVSTGTVTAHLAYNYDAANRRTRLILPEGKGESWGYDAAGRVNSLVQPGSSPATYTLSHDGAGDLTTLLAPNGGEQQWSYDGAGRVTGTSWFTGTTGLFTQTVTLDAAGQRTASHDSWGTSSYGYDAAGRLVSASYPDGSSEADQSDAGGNRTVITSTTTVGGTSVLTNTFDLADQLTVSHAPLGTTTYTYDGAGQQTGSVGITGIVTTTYNDLGQLTTVVGPGTNASYVYDGQGDRLRSYEQYGPTPVLHNDVQDLAAGMSDLVSDGTADYTYLAPGTGAAPLSAYNDASTRSSYLATDVLGSVRLATDPTGAVIGAGAYDAWGVYRPYSGPSGPTQLAGLQASSPFGYAGQYYDAGPGTYSMRAREYNPVQGRFLSQDPQSYAPQVPVTLNPYEYAGDMVTGTTDPSGAWWVAPTGVEAFAESEVIKDLLSQRSGLNLAAATFAVPGSGTAVAQAPPPGTANPGQAVAQTPGLWTNVWVIDQASCQHVSKYLLANVVDVQQHQVWDIENGDVYNPSAIAPGMRRLVTDMATKGFVLPYQHYADPQHYAVPTSAPTPQDAGVPTYDGQPVTDQLVFKDPLMQLGGRTMASFTLPTGATIAAVEAINESASYPIDSAPANQSMKQRLLTDSVLKYWWQQPGVILWHDHGDPCLSLNRSRGYVAACQGEIQGFVNDARNAAIIGGVGFTLLVAAAAMAGGSEDAQIVAEDQAIAEEDAIRAADVALAADEAMVQREASPSGATGEPGSLNKPYAVPSGCGCFPGDTKVATPHGGQAIATIKVGEPVLAEDPATGKITPEPVLALIDDGIKPLMALGFSDGSSLRVTTNHPFYVDGSTVRIRAGWVEAGDLRLGDRVRTASGHDLTVTSLRYQVGTAHVYTLTVAADHDFFVGANGVLVHNCALKPDVDIHAIPDPSVDLQLYVDGVKQRIGHLYDTEPGFPGHLTQVRNQYSRLLSAINQAARAGNWTEYGTLKQAQNQLLNALNMATAAAVKAGNKAAANFHGL